MNTRAAELESKIRDFTNLATKTAANKESTEIENKIFDATGSITSGFNRLTKISFGARVKEKFCK